MPYKKKTFQEFIDTITTSNIVPSHFYTNYQKIATYLLNFKSILIEMDFVSTEVEFIEKFKKIYNKDKKSIRIIPLFTAVRPDKYVVIDGKGKTVKRFNEKTVTFDEAMDFLREVNFFDNIKAPLHLYSYYFGVEVGMDTHARKNRSGFTMESLVESYVKPLGVKYIPQAVTEDMKTMGLEFKNDVFNGYKLDFVIFGKSAIYIVEANFFNKEGSKSDINTAFIDLKNIADKSVNNLNSPTKLIIITDGYGLKSAETQLKNVYDKVEFIINIDDLKKGVLEDIILS